MMNSMYKEQENKVLGVAQARVTGIQAERQEKAREAYRAMLCDWHQFWEADEPGH